MEFIGFLAFLILMASGGLGLVFLIGGLDARIFRDISMGMVLLSICAGLSYLEFSVSKTKDTLILINQDNVSKKDGTYSIKFFDESDQVYTTSKYHDIQLLNDMTGNEVCIKVSRDYDVYGSKFQDYRVVVSLCSDNENLIENSKDDYNE